MMPRLTRRSFLATLVAGVACGHPKERCARCGMILDPASAWNSDLQLVGGGVARFDSPRCALTAWRSGAARASALRVQEYYGKQWRDGREVAFVVGSDVIGPMGADLVPVDPARAAKFAADHAGTRPLRLESITSELLASIR